MKTLHFLAILSSAILLCGCASESVRRVRASDIVYRNKAVQHADFIGFADNRAFKLVRLIPFFPWSTPSQSIWWCPVSELSDSEIATLQTWTNRSPRPTRYTN
jgi:hypothetical protein